MHIAATLLINCTDIHPTTLRHRHRRRHSSARYNVSVAALAEILPVCRYHGLDPGVLAQIVRSGTGQSFGFDKFAPLVQVRRFDQRKPLDNARARRALRHGGRLLPYVLIWSPHLTMSAFSR